MFSIVETTSVVKAFSLLESLANSGGCAGLGELALDCGVTKPTARRLLQSLLSMGYIQQQEDRRYLLTSKLRWLAMPCGSRELASLAEEPLRDLHRLTDETVNLGILRRNRIVYVTILESTHPLRRVSDGQDSDPIFTTALGRAIAAHLPAVKLKQLLKSAGMEKRTKFTTVDPKKLTPLLERASRDGFAVEREETDVGVACVAAPVFAGGEVVAAVSVSAPTARIERIKFSELTAAVRLAASKISNRIAASRPQCA